MSILVIGIISVTFFGLVLLLVVDTEKVEVTSLISEKATGRCRSIHAVATVQYLHLLANSSWVHHSWLIVTVTDLLVVNTV